MENCKDDGENYTEDEEEGTDFIELKSRLELVESCFLSLGLFCCSSFETRLRARYVRGRVWEERLEGPLAGRGVGSHVDDEVGLCFAMFLDLVLRDQLADVSSSSYLHPCVKVSTELN